MSHLRTRILFSCLVFLIAGCAKTLTYQTEVPKFIAPADRALCVVIRPSAQYKDVAYLFVDTNCVGATTENTVTSFEISRGEHLVLSRIELLSRVKLNLTEGKIFYLLQDVSLKMIPFVGKRLYTSLVPISGSEAAEILESKKGILRFTKKSSNPATTANLSGSVYNSVLDDYAKWAEKEPLKARMEAEYPGY